jgi:plasmid stabilization system protein ParE
MPLNPSLASHFEPGANLRAAVERIGTERLIGRVFCERLPEGLELPLRGTCVVPE